MTEKLLFQTPIAKKYITDDFTCLPQDSRAATKNILEILLSKILPFVLRIRNKLHSFTDEDVSDVRDIYTLCSSQIKKCVINILDVFKLEFLQHTLLQESRQYCLERLTWCVNRLVLIEQHLEKRSLNSSTNQNKNINNSLNETVMYFVHWIDHTFEILNKLAIVIYKTDYKDTDALYEFWKHEMVECVSALHTSIEELLLSAMTLCRYCLPDDQHVVKARCQVVLRETKALLNELIEGDLSSTIKATLETLKLPIMPSNVNVSIDVLKDVLYVLETNTNTALLALLIHCFSYNLSPVDVLKDHFCEGSKGTCTCLAKSEDDITEDCAYVKDFDLYNERLLQIGSFAVSCSSDQNRILTLRSGLASLEVLDPHLVPALMTSPDSHHSKLLVNSWCREVQEIRDSVFLIVDPAAFAEKSKYMMHPKLLELLREKIYSNTKVCSVINIACVIQDFFDVYNKYEPDAIGHHENLSPLLSDLNKVIMECKIVCNLLSSENDFVYDVQVPKNKDVSMDQLTKRLKLLYTIVSRIDTLLHPKNEETFDDECENDPSVTCKNVTRTVYKNNTYLNSPRKLTNMSRSIFARTSNLRSSTRNFPLAKLTKHLRTKNCNELNFSVELDRLFESETKEISSNETFFVNKKLDAVRETSIFYNFSPIKNRSSLRKAVLNRHNQLTFDKGLEADVEEEVISEGGSLLDETTSLQLTEVLNQMNDMTSVLSTCNTSQFNLTQVLCANKTGIMTDKEQPVGENESNILTLNINNENIPMSKHIWNIPVNVSTDIPLEESAMTSYASNLTQPSNVTTLERINDLDFLESKLKTLKSQFETSL